MYEKIPISNMSHEEWLSLRKTGIGGSDAGTVCGLNPYGSLMKLYHDKTGDAADEPDSEAVRQGTIWSSMWGKGLWKPQG